MYVPFVCLLFAFFVFGVYFSYIDSTNTYAPYAHRRNRDRLRLSDLHAHAHTKRNTQTPSQAFYNTKLNRDNAHIANANTNQHTVASVYVCAANALLQNH